MTLNLSIMDRAVLIGMLPQKSNFTEQKMVKAIGKVVEFTEEEKEKYAISYRQDGNMTWKASGNKPESERQFKFSDEQFDLIKRSAKATDEKGEVTQMNVGICEKVLG